MLVGEVFAPDAQIAFGDSPQFGRVMAIIVPCPMGELKVVVPLGPEALKLMGDEAKNGAGIVIATGPDVAAVARSRNGR